MSGKQSRRDEKPISSNFLVQLRASITDYHCEGQRFAIFNEKVSVGECLKTDFVLVRSKPIEHDLA